MLETNPSALQFDVEKYVRNSKKIDISDLDLSQAARYPISDEEMLSECGFDQVGLRNARRRRAHAAAGLGATQLFSFARSSSGTSRPPTWNLNQRSHSLKRSS